MQLCVLSQRLPFDAWSTYPLHTLHVEAHATSGAGDSTHSGIHISSSQISLFGFGDLFQLSTSHSANLNGVRTSRTAGQASSFLQQNRSRGAFGFKGEATVAINSDDHWSRQTRLHALGAGVERL